MYVVYALVDPRDNKTFYVGMTNDVYERFAQHLRGDDTNLAKNARIQELRQANVMVLMSTLEIIEGVEQAKKRESYWIQHYYHLGMPLTNLVMPLIPLTPISLNSHDTEVSQSVENGVRLGPRMTMNEQCHYIASLLDLGMPDRVIYEHVERYIPPKVTRAILIKLRRAAWEQRNATMIEDIKLLENDMGTSIYDGNFMRKVRQVLSLDGEPEMSTRQIIRLVWNTDHSGRCGQAAVEELRSIRKFIAEQILSDLHMKMMMEEDWTLTQARKAKISTILAMDAKQESQNSIIRTVWGVESSTRQGRAAAEELKQIRAYLASMHLNALTQQ